jgi:hypothetical protein
MAETATARTVNRQDKAKYALVCGKVLRLNSELDEPELFDRGEWKAMNE